MINLTPAQAAPRIAAQTTQLVMVAALNAYRDVERGLVK